MEAAEFRAAVTGSSSDIFQKASNPQQVIQQKQQRNSSTGNAAAAVTSTSAAVGSPFRSNSLQLPDPASAQPGSNLDLRKRSCPNTAQREQQQHPTIHEDHTDDDDSGSNSNSNSRRQQQQRAVEKASVEAMAAAIAKHDVDSATVSAIHYGRSDSVPVNAVSIVQNASSSSSSYRGGSGGGGGRSPSIPAGRSVSNNSSSSGSNDPDLLLLIQQQQQQQQQKQQRSRVPLRKRMASDTDLLLSLGSRGASGAEQERQLRMASVIASASRTDDELQQQQQSSSRRSSSNVQGKFIKSGSGSRLFVNSGVEMPPGPASPSAAGATSGGGSGLTLGLAASAAGGNGGVSNNGNNPGAPTSPSRRTLDQVKAIAKSNVHLSGFHFFSQLRRSSTAD